MELKCEKENRLSGNCSNCDCDDCKEDDCLYTEGICSLCRDCFFGNKRRK